MQQNVDAREKQLDNRVTYIVQCITHCVKKSPTLFSSCRRLYRVAMCLFPNINGNSDTFPCSRIQQFMPPPIRPSDRRLVVYRLLHVIGICASG